MGFEQNFDWSRTEQNVNLDFEYSYILNYKLKIENWETHNALVVPIRLFHCERAHGGPGNIILSIQNFIWKYACVFRPAWKCANLI